MKKEINVVIATLLVLLVGCRSAKKETTVTSDMQKIEMNSVAIIKQNQKQISWHLNIGRQRRFHNASVVQRIY